jgi:hypothetical protein
VPEAEIVRVTLTVQVGNSYLKLVVGARLLAAVLRRGGTLLNHLTAAQNLTQSVFFSVFPKRIFVGGPVGLMFSRCPKSGTFS